MISALDQVISRRRLLLRASALMSGAAFAVPLLTACSSPVPAGTSAAATGGPNSATPATSSTTAESPRPGGVLQIGQDFGPQSLDPARSAAWASVNVQELIFTGLLRWNKDLNIEPDIGTSWDTPDAQTYVFHLRDNVTSTTVAK
ncbi:MAG: hypothetical protein JO352_02525 [Chloroflexi bacterium]|nr:hypothetical protein [Chloroflexota bacterium]